MLSGTKLRGNSGCQDLPKNVISLTDLMLGQIISMQDTLIKVIQSLNYPLQSEEVEIL